jgi:hypothetical protein
LTTCAARSGDRGPPVRHGQAAIEHDLTPCSRRPHARRAHRRPDRTSHPRLTFGTLAFSFRSRSWSSRSYRARAVWSTQTSWSWRPLPEHGHAHRARTIDHRCCGAPLHEELPARSRRTEAIVRTMDTAGHCSAATAVVIGLALLLFMRFCSSAVGLGGQSSGRLGAAALRSAGRARRRREADTVRPARAGSSTAPTTSGASGMARARSCGTRGSWRL